MDFILLVLHFDPISDFTALYGLSVESSLQLRVFMLHHEKKNPMQQNQPHVGQLYEDFCCLHVSM